MNEIVAPNVKRILRQKCLQQAGIAKKAGYTPHQFSSMMNGRKMIKDVDVVNIAAALQVDANELFKKGE